MPRRRTIPWSTILRDAKADRAVRPEIREERLHTAGLSTWRGRSGRRYVVQVHPLAPLDLTEAAVVIAVRPGAVVSAEAFEAGALGLASFRHVARIAGATELHVHRLAETAEARATVVADLR